MPDHTTPKQFPDQLTDARIDRVRAPWQIRTMPATVIDQAQVEAYRNDGYVLLPGVFDDAALQPVRAAIEAEVDQLADRLYRKGKVSSRFADQPFNRRLVLLCESAGESVRIWELRTRAAVTRELYQFVRHPGLLELMTAILGPEVAWTGSFAVRVKLPESEVTAFPWHQDTQYYGNPTQHLHVISVWIPLVDVDERNGCLHLVPGSHRWGLLGGARDSERVVRMFEDVEQRGTPAVLPMRRGDVLAFSNLTCHASTVNTTNQMRWSIDLRYMVPEGAAARSDDEREGYATIYDHYRMRPITVTSRDPDQVVPWEQIRNLIS